MIRHVTETEVRERLPISLALDAVERGLRARAEGRAHDVPRHAMRLPEGSLRVLAASGRDLGVAAYKATYSTGAASGRGYLHIVDLHTGELRAIVESVHLSRVRTGAASGIATRLLARQDAATLGVIGAGSQALAQVEAVCAVRAIRAIRVWSRDAARLRDFCARAAAAVGIDAIPAAGARAAIEGADVVVLITSAREPVIDGAWLEPGTHVNAAGSNALDRRELGEDAIERFDRIVVDARDVARHECGDLWPLVQRGTLSWDALPVLCEVLLGRAPGRRSVHEITLYESHGMGVQDLYAAHAVLDVAR
jgi:ornithine cyclodeaminase